MAARSQANRSEELVEEARERHGELRTRASAAALDKAVQDSVSAHEAADNLEARAAELGSKRVEDQLDKEYHDADDQPTSQHHGVSGSTEAIGATSQDRGASASTEAIGTKPSVQEPSVASSPRESRAPSPASPHVGSPSASTVHMSPVGTSFGGSSIPSNPPFSPETSLKGSSVSEPKKVTGKFGETYDDSSLSSLESGKGWKRDDPNYLAWKERTFPKGQSISDLPVVAPVPVPVAAIPRHDLTIGQRVRRRYLDVEELPDEQHVEDEWDSNESE